MNQKKNGQPPAQRAIQLHGQRAGKPQPHQPGLVQTKMAMSAQIKQPFVAPPVYRPQATPNAVQPKMANGAVSRKPPVAPPVYRPQQTPKVLQAKSSPAQSPLRSATQTGSSPLKHQVYGARPNVLQMAKCNCKNKGKHDSHCPRNPNRLNAKAAKDKVVKEEKKSIKNLFAYDTQWANKNGITDEIVKEFVDEKGEIHGHATSRADKDTKPHANTMNDIERFHTWYKDKYKKDDY